MSNDLPGAIAKVYLLQDGDEANLCCIDKETLLIIRKGTVHRINLDLVREIDITGKRFLLPLLMGGVFAPFFFLTLIKGMFHPFINLSGFLVGIYLFYLGYTGSHSIVVRGHGVIKEIFLPSISPNLRAFIAFVNEQVLQNRKSAEFNIYVTGVAEHEAAKLMAGKPINLRNQKLFPQGTNKAKSPEHKLADTELRLNIYKLDGKISYQKIQNEDAWHLIYNGIVKPGDLENGSASKDPLWE